MRKRKEGGGGRGGRKNSVKSVAQFALIKAADNDISQLNAAKYVRP